jgi:uncharacterized protein with von Willebrand factor type A (vWA) domain
MGKRRTRKDKVEARHTVQISWSPEASNKPGVKGQSKNTQKPEAIKISKRESAEQSAKESQIKAVKKDLVRSVLIALGIITLELVLYLAWNK